MKETLYTATSQVYTPTTFTAITSMARSECQWVTQMFTSPYTVTMARNNCSDDEIYSSFTTTVTSTATGLAGENYGYFTYATGTVGVYSTQTRTNVVNYYTTLAPSFSISAPLCQTAGCVEESIEECPAPAWSCSVGPNCQTFPAYIPYKYAN